MQQTRFTGATGGIVLAVGLLGPTAYAQDPPDDGPDADLQGPAEVDPGESETPEDPRFRLVIPWPSSEVTARPGEVSGIAVRERHRARALLWIPRIFLAVPRFALRLATEPLYQLAVLQERYRVIERAEDFFFNDERTFGIFPTLLVETGFGANVGLRLVHRDLFGHGESLLLRGGYGGRHRQEAELRLSTGELWSDVAHLILSLAYGRDDRERFYGIGNADEVRATDVNLPLPPIVDEAAVKAEYEEQVLEARLTFLANLGDVTTLELTHLWRRRWFDDGVEIGVPPLSTVYQSEDLFGYPGPLVDTYSGGRLHWQRRNLDVINTPPALPSSGFRADIWGGWQVNWSEDRKGFARLGFDVQPFINLFHGDRVLRLRLYVNTVIGSLDRIPFYDLPSLGGGLLHRGYSSDRFRGRIAALSTIEYRYPVLRIIHGYLFIDVGRVWNSLSELTFRGMRMSCGGGMIFFSSTRFLASIQLASSLDGGIQVRLRITTHDDIETGY